MKLAALLAITVAAAAVDACECVNSPDLTAPCCQAAGGHAIDQDCPASEISEELSTFAMCCSYNRGSYSDCTCSIGCLQSERRTWGLEQLSDDEARAIVDSYSA